MEAAQLMQNLIDEANKLEVGDEDAASFFLGKAKMITQRIFGEQNEQVQELNKWGFPASSVYKNLDDFKDRYEDAWIFSRRRVATLLNTLLEDMKIFGVPGTTSRIEESRVPVSNRIFVVHGHDEEMKQTVARVLTVLELEPIILHEQPNRGRTIIEKFADYADVSFAVILLSPDDMAYLAGSSTENTQYRARQNVILELGFFIGKLGRKNVVPLRKTTENFEMPSDYDGVIYTPYETSGQWKYKLISELQEAGYSVDANKIIRL